MSKAQTEEDELQDQYLKVKTDIEQAWPVFKDRNYRSRINLNFCQVSQWTEEERMAFEVQGRVPYIFDIIGSKVNHLIGTQQSTRLDASVLAMESGDDEKAGLLSKLVKWAEQMNRIEKVESSVFYSSAVKAAGCTVVRWKMKDIINGYPSVENIPIWQMLWDLSSSDVEGSDMRWMARARALRQSAWIEEYPQYTELIESAYTGQNTAIGGSNFVGMEPEDLMTSRQAEEVLYTTPTYGIERGSFVIGVEYYERIKDYEYVVVDAIEDKMYVYDEFDEAFNFANGLREGYSTGGELLLDAKGNDLVFVSENSKDCFYQTLIFADQIAHRIKVDIPDFPYQIAFAYFEDGTYWSPVDSLIDPQILYNRMVAEWDNQLGRSNKQFATVVRSMLDGVTIDDVNVARSKTGATIPVLKHEAINFVPNPVASPDLPHIINFADQFATNNVGGQNALGLQENAAESGKAVQYRQQAAGTAKLPLFDNLRTWRRKVTEMMVWYMQNFLDESQTIRIVGDDKRSVEFVDLDTGLLDTIREMRTDIQIAEQPDTETAKEMQYQSMMEVFKIAGDTIPAELKVMMMIKAGSLDPRLKEELLNGLQFYQEYQQKKMAMNADEKLVSEVETTIERLMIKGAALSKVAVQNPALLPQGGQDATGE